jgi:broad-specificity NMP kinase
MQNIYNIYEALSSRHGIMIVGRPTSGKTTSIRILQDVLTQLHLKEFTQKQNMFLKTKAERMGILTKTIKDRLVPKDSDPLIEYHFTLTEEEKQLILNTCQFKGINNFSLNPKSVTM